MDGSGDVQLSDSPGPYVYCSMGYWDGLYRDVDFTPTPERAGVGGVFSEHGLLCSDWTPGRDTTTCQFCSEQIVETVNGVRFCKEHLMKFRKEAAERRRADKRKTRERKDARRSKERAREEARFNKAVREVIKK